jgi:carbamoyl-phosphate synthase large subunit
LAAGQHILVSSAGAKAPLLRSVMVAAARLATRTAVFAGDSDASAPTQHIADGFWRMPATRDESLEEIIVGCRARGIGVVVPTRDGELAFWSRHLERLSAAEVHVLVSSSVAVERCLDKLAFASFGQAGGLPFIPVATRVEDLVTERFVVKERFGAGSRGLGLDLDAAAASAHASRLQHPIFQPFVRGTEISVDAWVGQDHRVIGVVLRKRDLVRNGESQITTTFRNPSIEAEAARVIESLQLRGPVVLQAILDQLEQFHVIEVNARFGGASTAGIAAGLDPWYWSLLELSGARVDAGRFRRTAGEVKQVRLPTDLVIHAADL